MGNSFGNGKSLMHIISLLVLVNVDSLTLDCPATDSLV